MFLSLALGLILGAASVVFALQNVFPVTVTFFAWQLTASLAVLIILALLAGIVISALVSIPGAIRNAFTISKLKKENRKLVEEVEAAHAARPVVVAAPAPGEAPVVVREEV